MRRALQIAVAIGSLVPVSAGLTGMILGPDMIGQHIGVIDLDSHYRYLSGLLFGIGLGFLSTIPQIERKADRFQLLTLIVFTGGLSRLLSLAELGAPSPPMLFGLAMELAVTPLLCFWQFRVAKG